MHDEVMSDGHYSSLMSPCPVCNGATTATVGTKSAAQVVSAFINTGSTSIVDILLSTVVHYCWCCSQF